MTPKPIIVPKPLTEAQEQNLCVEYLNRLKYLGQDILYTATAQATYTTSWSQKNKNRTTGVTRGLPDLIIILNAKLIFIEMKRTKGGTTSKEQKVWIQKLNEAGQFAYICKGFKEFKTVIEGLLLSEIDKED